MNEKTKPLTTVYSCFFPEIAEIVNNQQADFGFLRNNITHTLDDYATPLFDLYEQVMLEDNQVQAWPSFNRYYTNGSSEGLFHLISQAALTGKPLYQLEGEYQGYQAYARAVNSEFIDLNKEEISSAQPGIFFVSNPSAVNGNVLDQELLDLILSHHQVVLDLAYLGMTEPMRLPLDHPNLQAIVASMSKPFGLYYFRIGFCWSRKELPSLYGNKWFKNVASILLGKEVLNRINLQALRSRGQIVQRQALELTKQEWDIDLRASDVYLLGITDKEINANPEFKRAEFYRFCLTPYFYELIDCEPTIIKQLQQRKKNEKP